MVIVVPTVVHGDTNATAIIMLSTPIAAFLSVAVGVAAFSSLALNGYLASSDSDWNPHTIHYASTYVQATVRSPDAKFEVKKDGKVLLSTDAVAGTKLWAPYNVSDGPHQLGFCKASANGTAPCVSLQAPTTLTASSLYSLPVAPPTEAGRVLTSSTAGAMSWTSTLAGATVQVGSTTSTVDVNTSAGGLRLNGVSWPTASPTASGQSLESTSTSQTAWVTKPTYLSSSAVEIGGTTSSVRLNTSGALFFDGVQWPTAAPTATGQLLESTGTAQTAWVTQPAYLRGGYVGIGGTTSDVRINTGGNLSFDGVQWPTAAPTAAGQVLVSTGTSGTEWALPTVQTATFDMYIANVYGTNPTNCGLSKRFGLVHLTCPAVGGVQEGSGGAGQLLPVAFWPAAVTYHAVVATGGISPTGGTVTINTDGRVNMTWAGGDSTAATGWSAHYMAAA